VVTRPGRWLSLLALISVLSLVGCAAAAASAPAPSPLPTIVPTAVPSPRPALRIAFSERYGGNAALWVAYAVGLFHQQGLDATLLQMPDRMGLSALAAGDVEVVVGPGAAAITAAAAGIDLRLVAGLVNVSPHRLIVDPSIESAADLRGMRLGTSRPGSPSDLALRQSLRALGLDPAKDVVLLQIGSAPERQAALENGAIQGAVVVPPESTQLERLEFRTLLNLATSGVEMPNNQVAVAAAVPRERPALVQRLVDVLVEGTALAKRDRALAKRVLGEYLQLTDDAALDDTYELFVQQLAPRAPYPARAGLRHLSPTLIELEPRIVGVDLTAIEDRRFVQRAVDSGLVSRLYAPRPDGQPPAPVGR
jgi:NitT/TauT family transport system substrate-binding protein